MNNTPASDGARVTILEGLSGPPGRPGRNGRDGKDAHRLVVTAPLTALEQNGSLLLTASQEALCDYFRNVMAAGTPVAGTHIAWACVGMTRIEVVADGKGGFRIAQSIPNSPQCGGDYPAQGTHLEWVCSGTTRIEKVADGVGGWQVGQVIPRSPDCGFSYPQAGEHLYWKCFGTTRVEVIADGGGGYAAGQIAPNSAECGQVSCPPQGTVLDSTCSGTTLIRTVADGNCGSSQVYIPNASECGYVPCPAAGTVLNSTCVGTTLVQTVANGSCGTTQVSIPNSGDCGYGTSKTLGMDFSIACRDHFHSAVQFTLTYDAVTQSATVTGFVMGDTSTDYWIIEMPPRESSCAVGTGLGNVCHGPCYIGPYVVYDTRGANPVVSNWTTRPTAGQSLLGLVFTGITPQTWSAIQSDTSGAYAIAGSHNAGGPPELCRTCENGYA